MYRLGNHLCFRKLLSWKNPVELNAVQLKSCKKWSSKGFILSCLENNKIKWFSSGQLVLMTHALHWQCILSLICLLDINSVVTRYIYCVLPRPWTTLPSSLVILCFSLQTGCKPVLHSQIFLSTSKTFSAFIQARTGWLGACNCLLLFSISREFRPSARRAVEIMKIRRFVWRSHPLRASVCKKWEGEENKTTSWP